jgi:DNA replication protein DnaC
MLTHPSLDQLKTLKLDGMAEAFAELEARDGIADLAHAEWLGLLVDRETANRETKRFESRMRTARLRHVGASPEDVDYRARRGLEKALDHCPRTNGGQGLAPGTADWKMDL